MVTTDLTLGWEFRQTDRPLSFRQPHVQHLDWLPATVPGHVHLDLMANGILPEVFTRCFEFGSQWVDEVGWTYRVRFEWQPKPGAPRRVLRFAGLDTVATVRLNGQEVAQHDNMHLPLEVDVTELLARGLNEIRVEFDPAVGVGMKRRKGYFRQEGLDWATDQFDERAFIRKAAYMYGWDWGPRFVSCGVWQPVCLLEFAARLVDVRWRMERQTGGMYEVAPEAVIDGDADVKFTLAGMVGGPGSVFQLKPELWWPNGYGEQPRYEATAELGDGDRHLRQLGFRTIELRREADELGASFQFVVNGLPIFARGANWIPNDAFPSRISAVDYDAQVRQCRELNMNMLRVWGGGLYETEPFYDACDRHGLLVWQDFPFACSYYPDNAEARAALEREAAHHVTRLRDRPSLAVWCGNNENQTMWEGKWGRVSPPRYYGAALYDEVLPAVVSALAADCPYVASSPIGGAQANADDFGDQHYWNAWHGVGDWRCYTESRARFCSEFGFASACMPSLWSLTLVDSTLGGAEHLSHDKTGKPWDVFMGYVELHYPHPTSLDAWTVLSQLNQRDAMRHAIEHFRRVDGCAGALVWQFNDCWPVQSWSLQDYGRNLKVAGWEMARLCAPVLLSATRGGGTCCVWLSNDSPARRADKVIASLVRTADAAVVHVAEFDVETAPGEREQVGCLDIADASDMALCCELAGVPSATRWELLAEPKDANLVACDLVETAPGEYRIDGFVCDLIAWQGDRWLVADEPRSNAVTACRQTVKFTLTGDEPVRLVSLAGPHRIVPPTVQSPSSLGRGSTAK